MAMVAAALSAFATPPAGDYEVRGDEFNKTSLGTTKWDYWLLGPRRDAMNVTNAVSLNGSNLVITTYASGLYTNPAGPTNVQQFFNIVVP